MRRLSLLSVFAVALVLPNGAAAQSEPAPNVADPIVVGLEPSPPPSFAGLFVQDSVVSVTCEGRPVTPVHSERLPPTLSLRPPGAPEPAPPEAEAFTFAIAAGGRPVSIRLEPTARSSGLTYIGPAPDSETQASLASWRFAPQPQRDCRLSVERPIRPAADAPEPLLARTLALTSQARQRPVIRAALARPGDDCVTGAPLRTRVYPDHRAEPAPGGRSWAAVRYSIDTNGRTFDVEVLDASSNRVGAALRDSMAASTFAADRPRTGCVAVTSRYGDPLGEAPPFPAELEAANQCGPEVLDRMTVGALDYPDAMLNRGVEGWAVIRFDLASWGKIGGIEVLAAEPAASFGTAAQQMFRNARVTPSGGPAAGCARRVVFRLPLEGETGNAR